jgi:hypothetical protein
MAGNLTVGQAVRLVRLSELNLATVSADWS